MCMIFISYDQYMDKANPKRVGYQYCCDNIISKMIGVFAC